MLWNIVAFAYLGSQSNDDGGDLATMKRRK
jgi:hypothetical protein